MLCLCVGWQQETTQNTAKVCQKPGNGQKELLIAGESSSGVRKPSTAESNN